MRAKIALKNCPFCGGKVSLNLGMLVRLPMIYCKKCGANVSFYGNETPERTIKQWNKRTEDEN